MNIKRLLCVSILLAVNSTLYAQTGLDKTAQQIAAEMIPGWNLGNTLEANRDFAITEGATYKPAVTIFSNYGGLESETAWQKTKTTQEVIDYVKSLGFRSVRIPCSWVWGHLSNPKDYTIDATWMQLHVTGEAKTKNEEVLRAIWTQIANTFKDYDEHLIFAGLNEPSVEDEATLAHLVSYEQIFIDAVRATGGNNAKRLLVVQGPSTDAEKTCNWMTDKLPKDPIGRKLAIEVHLYYPWNFWGMTEDAGWGNVFFYWGKENHVSSSSHNATYGEESDVIRIADRLKTCFVDKGIPVINGEYGIIWRTITGEGESQEKHNASIKTYYKTMNRVCMERGIVPIVWDTNSSGINQMTVLDRSTRTIFNPYMMEGIREGIGIRP